MYIKITHRQHHIESLSVMIFHSFFYFVANIFASISTIHYSSYHFYHLSRLLNPSEPIKQLLKKNGTVIIITTIMCCVVRMDRFGFDIVFNIPIVNLDIRFWLSYKFNAATT